MTLLAFAMFNGLLLCAAFTDVRSFRIPNPISAMLALAGVLFHPPGSVGEFLVRLASVLTVALVVDSCGCGG